MRRQSNETNDLLETIGGGCFSPDEREIAFASDKTGVLNVYTADLDSGVTQPMTDSDVSILPVTFFPDDDRLLLRVMRDTDAAEQLWVHTEAEMKPITPAGVHAEFLGWSRDGASFFVLFDEQDVLSVHAATYAMTRLHATSDARERVICIDRDGRCIALRRSDPHCAEIRLVDLTSSTSERVAAGNDCYLFPEYFDASGRYLHYVTDANDEFRYAARYDRATRQSTVLERHEWDVLCTSMSPGETYFVLILNRDAETVLRITRRSDGREIRIPVPFCGKVDAVEFSRSERKVAFYAGGDRCPRSLGVWEIGADTAMAIAAPQPFAPAEEFVDSEVVRFRSFDGVEIPGLLYRPQTNSEKAVPAMVWVHGGPGGQARKRYDPLIQVLATNGYAVFAVNYRGSGGYGKSFEAADRGKLGREPLWDCIEARRFLARLPGIDGRRIAIGGESFGGYMALAALAFHPGEFAAGIDYFGIADWLDVLRSMPDHWSRVRDTHFARIGNPSRDEERLRAVSPLYAADRIQEPLLVAQGGRDVRVPRSQSDALVEKVRSRGVAVEHIVYEDEAHGILNAANRADLFARTLAFLDRNLH